MRSLLSARRILLLAFGAAKADAVHAMLARPPDLACPASWLQEHAEVEVFLDEPAARRWRLEKHPLEG
jgi:glucosamine-6-phosphate deaminase